MTTDNSKDSQYEMVNSLQSMMESVNAGAIVWARAVEDLLRIQLELSAANGAENSPREADAQAQEGPMRLLWQVPNLFQAQSQRLVRLMIDTCAVLARTQQQLLELDGKSLSWAAQRATRAMTQVTGTIANRRTLAREISFADRRATLQAVSAAVATLSADAAWRSANPSEGWQAVA